MPKVSILAPAYNHEKYVTEAIESALNQTFHDFELIIFDDCSPDSTVEKIKLFNDPRIKLYTNKQNKGIAANINNCYKHATGEYITFLATDDVYMPDKLEKQVNFLNKNPDIALVSSHVKLIDDDSNDIDNNHFCYQYFKQPNKTRFQWLNDFFYIGNCLSNPAYMFRRSAYEDIGPYFEERQKQINDYDVNIRFCMKYDIHIIQEELIKYRLRANEGNASSNNQVNTNRTTWETYHLLKTYCEIESIDDLLKIFPDLEKQLDKDTMDKDLIPFYVAKLALNSSSPSYQLFGLNTMYEILGSKEMAEKLEILHNFNAASLIKFTGKFKFLNPKRSKSKNKIFSVQICKNFFLELINKNL